MNKNFIHADFCFSLLFSHCICLGSHVTCLWHFASFSEMDWFDCHSDILSQRRFTPSPLYVPLNLSLPFRSITQSHLLPLFDALAHYIRCYISSVPCASELMSRIGFHMAFDTPNVFQFHMNLYKTRERKG